MSTRNSPPNRFLYGFALAVIGGATLVAALAYGELMGAAARQGLSMSAPDGMIAAIARVSGGRLATRNLGRARPRLAAGLPVKCDGRFRRRTPK